MMTHVRSSGRPAAVVLYVYFGYPVLLLVWSRLRPRPVHPHPDEPPVSVIIAVRDEAEALERKIANLRSLDYPRRTCRSWWSRTGTTGAPRRCCGATSASSTPSTSAAAARRRR